MREGDRTQQGRAPYQGRPGRGILYPLGWLIALSSGDIVSPLISTTLLTGSVSQGSPGTASAVLFLGKLQRTLQRTRTQVESLGGVGLRSGVLVGVPEVKRTTSRMGGKEKWGLRAHAYNVGLVAGKWGGCWWQEASPGGKCMQGLDSPFPEEGQSLPRSCLLPKLLYPTPHPVSRFSLPVLSPAHMTLSL